MFLQFVTVHRFQLLYLGNQNIMEEENKHFTSGLKQIVKRSTCLSHTETILVYRIQDVTSTQQFILLAYNLRLPICSMSLQTTFMASRNQIMCFVIPQQVRPGTKQNSQNSANVTYTRGRRTLVLVINT